MSVHSMRARKAARMPMREPKVEVVYDYKHVGSDATLTPATVWLRVYFSRTQRKYISTGVRVLPSQWSESYWVVNHPASYQLNIMIKEQVEKAKATIGTAIAEQSDMPGTRAMKVDRKDASFLDFLKQQIDIAEVTEDTRKHHVSLYNLLCEYGKIRKFEHVTKTNISAFLRFVSTKEILRPGMDGQLHPTKLKQSTVHDHWKRLRKYIRIAQAEQLIPMHVTAGISVDRGEEPEREHLTDAEIDAWLKTRQSLPYLEAVRLRFIIQMGTGLSFRDLMEKDFTSCEDFGGQTVLVDRRTKTKQGFFAVVLPFAVEVLKQWDWKVPEISNVDYNKYLDRVAQNCKIRKHITSHVARHTYACYCLRHGVRIEAVKRALGHRKLETTQIYARLADMDVLEAFKKSDIL